MDLMKKARTFKPGSLRMDGVDIGHLANGLAARIEQLERELAAERKRAEGLHRRAQKAEGKNARYAWWFRVISGIAKHHKDWRVAQYARAGIDGAALHMGTAWIGAFNYWKKEFRAELDAEKALADRLWKEWRSWVGEDDGHLVQPHEIELETTYLKAREQK